ncbi:hypothetical protein F5146DRAFT_972151 [Armillaria mellea]|nr:hypothetical protein F5146DRAFT_972151 [Armillaria mellea]
MPSLSSFYLIPHATNSLEFIGELIDKGFSVTQGLGGSMELSEDQLSLRYQSFCNPWLNFEHSLGNSVPLSFLKGNETCRFALGELFQGRKVEEHRIFEILASCEFSYTFHWLFLLDTPESTLNTEY